MASSSIGIYERAKGESRGVGMGARGSGLDEVCGFYTRDFGLTGRIIVVLILRFELWSSFFAMC